MAQLSKSIYLANKTNLGFSTSHFGNALLNSSEFKKLAAKARRQYLYYSSVNTNCFRLFFIVKHSQLYLPFLVIYGKGIQFGDFWTRAEAECHA
jgi:hypothetical protein